MYEPKITGFGPEPISDEGDPKSVGIYFYANTDGVSIYNPLSPNAFLIYETFLEYKTINIIMLSYFVVFVFTYEFNGGNHLLLAVAFFFKSRIFLIKLF